MPGPTRQPHSSASADEGAMLSPELVEAIHREARARHRKPDALVREWLEDLADARAVERARKHNAGKPNTPWSEVKRELGL